MPPKQKPKLVHEKEKCKDCGASDVDSKKMAYHKKYQCERKYKHMSQEHYDDICHTPTN